MDRLESVLQGVAVAKRQQILDRCNNGDTDQDLPPEDRPNRVDRTDLGNLKDFDDVDMNGSMARVLCPGRTRGFFYMLTIDIEQGFVVGQDQAVNVTDRAPFDPEESPLPIFPEPESP